MKKEGAGQLRWTSNPPLDVTRFQAGRQKRAAVGRDSAGRQIPQLDVNSIPSWTSEMSPKTLSSADRNGPRRSPYEALKKKMCSEYVKFSGHALSV